MTFVDEPIQVIYKNLPLLEKVPTCPNAFLWREEEYLITAVLQEWKRFERKGRMARNMSPAHARRAASRGSWGVGKYYFKVQTSTGHTAVIYYDRAPEGSDEPKGSWTLFSFE